MTATQEGALQQQPIDTTQQGQPVNSAPASQINSGQPPQAQQSPAAGGGQAQGLTLPPEFTQALQQQIAQAMQPVLNDFRQQMSQTVESQAAQLTGDGATGTAGAAGVAQGAQATAQPMGAVQQTLQPALKTVERQSEELLGSMLVSGLNALLSETTHAAIQHAAERALHALLEKLFQATAEGTGNREILLKVEGTLQAILREALDAVFAAQTRATLQQGGQAALQGSFHGDFGDALKHIEDILKALGAALLAVLQRERQTVLRLALALALLAIGSSLADNQRQPAQSVQPTQPAQPPQIAHPTNAGGTAAAS